MKVNIYIASSIRGPAKRDGIVGFVEEMDSKKECTLTQYGSVNAVSENESYLIALKYALKRLTKSCDEVEVWLDNNYVAAAFEQNWIEQWQRNDWKNSKGKKVSENWQETLNCLNGRGILFKVKEKNEYRTYLQEECERRMRKKDA